MFPVQGWLYVMIGQDLIPRGYDPMADSLEPGKIKANLEDIRAVVKRCADAMPPHQEFIDKNCSSLPLSQTMESPGRQKMITYTLTREP